MFAAATVFAYGCSDNFDDSALWKDIDGMYKSLNELKAQVTTMQQQLDALAAVVSGGAVTSITQDADGHYVLSYKDADNVEHTIDIATMDDANTQPIIGMKADGEIYYWTVTTGGKTSWLLDTDGAKIPVTGRTPEIGVDDQGYWTLFGKRITDASGNPVKAEGKSASVITKVEMKDDGTVVFTLGDGVQVTAQVQNGFNVLLSVEPRTVVTDVAQPFVITYTLVGETETSVLTVEKAEGLAAKLDEQAKTITVTFPDGFEEGRLVVMFYDGALTCGTIANTGNGSNSGFHQGGIVGYMKTSSLTECTNNGALSAPSGRSGGIVAVATSGQVTACVNNGKVQDDVNGIFGANPGYKRMGGLAGGASADAAFTSCVNNGDVFSQLGCRTGGFVGHNEAKITKCENKGVILSDHTLSGTNYHGSGWAAGYNKSADLITECVVGGRVGDYTAYKDNPQSAPEATYAMAIVHGKFDPTLNGLSDQYEEFYDWEVKAETQLAEGVKFYHYAMKNFAQNVYVVEADLTNPNVVFETVMADELCLNPNANNNSNNGKKLRETLSETCTRRRAEGRNIVAGINTGFFNSHDGFPRGFHIEYGEPVFINNPTVRQSLSNHRPGFTFFEDRTVSFDNRSFTGYLKVNDTDYEYYSVNDTIVRLNNTDGYDANLYTSRFRKEPHPGIYNPVGSDALFVVGRCSQQMTVNDGWFDATVTAIVDGRNGASVEVPFVSEKTDWVLQVTGEKAAALAAALKVGDAVRINANVSIGSVSKQIIMHNSSMYRFLNGGNWNAVNDATLMPATCIGADQAGTTVKLVCVDGRTSIDTGMNYWQLYMTMKKLGLHNAIRFDGGGSTTLWKWENGAGAIANRPCDSKGERSCMNYMHVRIK